MPTQEQLKTILQTQFGFENFRKGQLEAICALMERNRLLCIQPTGHGKSLLYQLPSVLLDGVTLVISPLLALMRDQMMQLQQRFNLAAASINSDQTEEENSQARFEAHAGKIKILFVAPEQLDNITQFDFLLALPVSLIVVDEAHCISTWGHDFRPSYRQIVQLVQALTKKNAQVKVLGLTATANSKTEEDIKQQLTDISQPVLVHRENMDRPNIQLSTLQVQGMADKLFITEQLVTQLKGDGLIYCATRENTELVAEYLKKKKINAVAYHAGFNSDAKRRLQHEFTHGKYKVIAATNALGMGIDKSDLRFIIHFDVPGSITAYYQEVGRCGRDGLPARGILLFNAADKRIQEHFINSAQPTPQNFQTILQAVNDASAAPKLIAIKRLVGFHPTIVTVVIAELVEQGYLQKMLQRISSGVAVFDGKLHAPLFIKFMRERMQDVAIAPELLDLIKKTLALLAEQYQIGCVISFPSRTWKARETFVQFIAQQIKVPVLLDYLYWREVPAARQGELLNNDQRRYNVDNKMAAELQRRIPSGAILLIDDYIGSGATLKEAARVLRKAANIKQEIVPFMIASIKWHLGKRGMV